MASRATHSSPHSGSSGCQSTLGRAFSVDDGLLALRWAEIVRSRGYRLRFSHEFAEADEAIEVYQQPRKRALATIFLGVHWVWIVDRAGHTTPHEDVAEALTFLVELTDEERRALLAPSIPTWLWQSPPPKPMTEVGWHKFPGIRSETVIALFKQIRDWHRRKDRT